MTMNCVRYSTLALIATLLGGCAMQATGFVNDKSVSVRAATTEAVVAEDGKCTATTGDQHGGQGGADGFGVAQQPLAQRQRTLGQLRVLAVEPCQGTVGSRQAAAQGH